MRLGSSGGNSFSGVALVMKSEKSNAGSSNVPETSFHEDDDATGCVPPFVNNYPRNKSWIAVVKGGGCTFNEKVKNAKELNASGVLVYDIEDGKPLQSMKGIITKNLSLEQNESLSNNLQYIVKII